MIEVKIQMEGGRKEGTNKLVALKERGEYSYMVFDSLLMLHPFPSCIFTSPYLSFPLVVVQF